MSDRVLRSATKSTASSSSTTGQSQKQKQKQKQTQSQSQSQSQAIKKTVRRRSTASQPKGRCAYITRSATKKRSEKTVTFAMRSCKPRSKSVPPPILASPDPPKTPIRDETTVSERKALLDQLFVSHSRYLPDYTVTKGELEQYQRVFKRTSHLTTAELLEYFYGCGPVIGQVKSDPAMLRAMLFEGRRSMKKLRDYFAGIALVAIASDVDAFRRLSNWEQRTFAEIEGDLREAGKSPFEGEYRDELERLRKKYSTLVGEWL